MKLAFYLAANGNWLDHAIAEYDNGPFSHVELVEDATDLSHAACFSSSPRDGGVRRKTINLTDGEWTVVDLPPFSPEQVEQSSLWATSVLGAGYDWWGVFGFVVPLIHEDSKKWFCSEVCLTALQKAGFLPDVDAGETSPNKLFELVRT